MATLKEFEDALREAGNTAALEVLAALRERDRANRTIRPARRITGRKMTPELAQEIVHLNRTTNMTQQEIAFQLGVNQGRVNEVLKRGKWLNQDEASPEAENRRKALERARDGVGFQPRTAAPAAQPASTANAKPKSKAKGKVAPAEAEILAAPAPRSSGSGRQASRAPVIDVEPVEVEPVAAKPAPRAKAPARKAARAAAPVSEESVTEPSRAAPARKSGKTAAARAAAEVAAPVAPPVVTAPRGKGQKDKDKEKDKGRKPGDATLQLPFDGL